MPLLPPEPFLYPDDVLSRPIQGAESERWWVLHTRPRAEKSLARSLLRRRVAFFLPLYGHEWRKRGRSFRSQLPLFPGYVFLRGSESDRLHALETNLLARVLPVPDQVQLQGDLARVHQLIASNAPLVPEHALRPGSRVEIICGPLEGLEGKVLRQGKRLRFFVEIQFLQRAVSMEIESWMIQPLEARRDTPVTRSPR